MDGFHKTYEADIICKGRNYQIDAVKFFLSVCIFLYHARIFAPAGSVIRDVSNKFGWFSVHFFFVISGLFMAAHYFKAEEKAHDDDNCGKHSFLYVIGKIKSIAPLYYITFTIDFIIYYILILYNNKFTGALSSFVKLAAKSIPEILTLQMCGIRDVGINSVTWYLSASFIAALPMYYIMKKKPDFFFYILSPLLAMSLFAFFYNSSDPFFDQNSFVFVFTCGFLRAVCGISFGILAYMLADFIKCHMCEVRRRRYLTAAEILLTLFFITVWFSKTLEASVLFPTAMLFPVLLAIIYSEKSYVSALFRTKCFKYLGTWSMWLYMNHYAARKIIMETSLASISDYKVKYLLMAALTLLSCAVCLCIMRIFKVLSIIRSGKKRKTAVP